MITPTDIVKHLKTYLPAFTGVFTESPTVTAAVISAGNILTVTAPDHGKSVGQYVVIFGGTVRNPLTVSALIDGRVQFTTVYDHDVIRPSLSGDDQELTLGGFGGVWDGLHDIIDVPNRRNIILDLPTGEVTAPPVDESQYLIESLLVGAYEIKTVPDSATFTLDFSESPGLPVGTVDNLSVMTGIRVSAAADYERARAIYAEQIGTDPYLFVIMTDTDVSKDRHTLNDGVAGMTVQDTRLLRLLQSFSTTVFIPTTGDISGSQAQDLAYGDLFDALLSVLFGYQVNGASAIRYLNVPSGMGPGEYNSAFYVHVYDWQLPTAIDYSDGFIPSGDVAFRDIFQSLKVFNDAEAEMSVNINLDDEPI